MALTGTTLAAALNDSDNIVVVASSTGFSAGNILRCEDEIMQVQSSYVVGTNGVNIPVVRGWHGTANVPHATGQYAVTGLGSDFPNPGPGGAIAYPIFGRSRTIRSYAADGAIELPLAGGEAYALLTKTSALAMTLADPTKDMDGAFLFICAGTKVAHVVVSASGFGGNPTTLTMDANTAQAVLCIAFNTRWLIIGAVITTPSDAQPGLA